MLLCAVHPLPYQPNPADYFALIRQAPGAVLLDSGRPVAERGRFDLMSAWPLKTFEPGSDETGQAYLQRLRDALQGLGRAELPGDCALPFAGGVLGYLTYDFGRSLEPRLSASAQSLPGNAAATNTAQCGLYAWALLSDHQARTSQLVFHPRLEADQAERLLALFSAASSQTPGQFQLQAPFQADSTFVAYQTAFEHIQAYIQAGDCYQVNFAQRFHAPSSGDPWAAYCALRAACPTPFSGYIALGGDDAVVSLSPERFVRVHEGQVQTRPIKGTRPRHTDPQQDAHYAAQLLASPKDRAENLMIVDLLRNDLGRSCRPGSIRVPELFQLESYPNVHHLVSCVTGELAPEHDAVSILATCFPGGSITGAPKIRAMQIIAELEPEPREVYCGSLFYLDVRGAMDSSIAIRTLLIRDGHTWCWGGGGIVADSAGEAEYQESIAKVRVLLETLEKL